MDNNILNKNEYNDYVKQQFKKAMELTFTEFYDCILRIINQFLPAKSLVVKAIETRFDIHKSGKIIKLESSCPWKEHLHNLEESMKIDRLIYVLFEDKVNNTWRVQCVPEKHSVFESRKPLPFNGLRDENLSKAANINDLIFVHQTGFIGGAKNYDSALKLAIKGLE